MLGADLLAPEYFARIGQVLTQLDCSQVQLLADWIYECWKNQQSVFIFGNGGSACAASHFAEDLAKGTLSDQALRQREYKRIRVISLTDNVGWITALANDMDYEQIFLQQLINLARPGDLAIGISVSGNSRNVLAAIDWANNSGLRTFGMSGFDGGRLKQIQQAGVHVPLDDMGMVEAIHSCVMHWVTDDLFARINRCGRYATA